MSDEWSAWACDSVAKLAAHRQRATRVADPWTAWAWRKQHCMKMRDRNTGNRERPRPMASQLLGLVRAQGFTCALSGEALTPENATVDHGMPLSRGGDRGVGNLIVVTEEVNRAKGSLSVEEFVSLSRRVAAHVPHPHPVDFS